MSRDEPRRDREAYEVRVNGLLGPILLAALPHSAVSLEPRHTLVVTRGGRAGDDLVDLMRLLLDTGIDVVSVREISAGRTNPEPGALLVGLHLLAVHGEGEDHEDVQRDHGEAPERVRRDEREVQQRADPREPR